MDREARWHLLEYLTDRLNVLRSYKNSERGIGVTVSEDEIEWMRAALRRADDAEPTAPTKGGEHG